MRKKCKTCFLNNYNINIRIYFIRTHIFFTRYEKNTDFTQDTIRNIFDS